VLVLVLVLVLVSARARRHPTPRGQQSVVSFKSIETMRTSMTLPSSNLTLQAIAATSTQTGRGIPKLIPGDIPEPTLSTADLCVPSAMLLLIDVLRRPVLRGAQRAPFPRRCR